MNKKNPHWGSTLNDFLLEEMIRDTMRADALTLVVARRFRQEMKREGIIKARITELPRTGRAWVDRIRGSGAT